MARLRQLPALLRGRATDRPDAPALAVDDGRHLTYEQWEHRSNALGRGLTDRGVAPGDKIALLFENARWTDFAVAYMAVHKTGGVPVSLTPRLFTFDLQRILRDCAPAGAITLGHSMPPETVPWALSPADLEDGQTTEPLPTPVPPRDGEELLYSFGPLSPARSTCWPTPPPVFDDMFELDRGPNSGPLRMLHAFFLGTEAGQAMLQLPLVVSNATATLLPRFDPTAFSELLCNGNFTHIGLTPAWVRMLASALLDGQRFPSIEGVALFPSPTHQSVLLSLRTLFPEAIVSRPRPSLPETPSRGRRSTGSSSFEAPISLPQQEMIWREQFSPGCLNLPPFTHRWHGALSAEALQTALSDIVARHAILRTTFEMREGRVVQVVNQPGPTQLPLVDLTGLPSSDIEPTAARLISAMNSGAVDLTAGPLFDPRLFRLRSDDHVLAISVHHCVWDDLSGKVFDHELASLYDSHLGADTHPLSELSLRFVDFARTQDEARSESGLEGQISYWNGQLAGGPLSVQLPLDDPELPPGAMQQSSEVSIQLPVTLVEPLRTISRQQHSTLFMTLLASLYVLIARYTGLSDVVVDCMLANRGDPELFELIGCFADGMPLRVRCSGDLSFLDVLANVREVVLGALSHVGPGYSHRAAIKDSLVLSAAKCGLRPAVMLTVAGLFKEDLDVELSGLRAAAFDRASLATGRVHHLQGAHAVSPSSLRVWGSGLYLGTFPVFSFHEGAGGVSCMARGAFHPPAGEAFLYQYRAVLEAVVEHQSIRVSDLARPGDERSARPTGGRTSREKAAPDAAAVFADQVAMAPDRPALEFDDVVWSYAEVDARANSVARQLRSRGVQPGSVVGLCGGPSPEAVVGALGIWKASGAYVGLDLADADRLDFILRATATDLVVTPGTVPETPWPGSVRVVPIDVTRGPEGATAAPPDAGNGPDDQACLFYRSGDGCTGQDGVAIDHRSVLSLVARLRPLLASSTHEGAPSVRACLSSGPAEEGFLRQLVALLDGHTLRVTHPTSGDTAASVVSGLAEGVIDFMECSAPQVRRLQENGLAAALRGRSERGIAPPTLVVASTEPVEPTLRQRLRQLGPARISVLYGPAEASFAATASWVSELPARTLVGHPLDDVEASAVDAQGRALPAGAAGELVLRGPCVVGEIPPGGAPVAQRILLDPSGTRTLRTGLLARLTLDGSVELLGSTRHTVDFRGFRLDLSRLEAAMAGSPGVGRVAVTIRRLRGVPDLVAFVVPNGHGSPTVPEMRQHLWRTLPGYAWPNTILIVDELPMAADGSLDTTAGLAREDGPTAGDDPASEQSLEVQLLSSLWAEALGVERVDPSDSYWQELSFLEVLDTAHQAGFPVDPRHVRSNRTLETLAVAMAACSPE